MFGELKKITLGSGKTYSSASAAAKQMSLDACGGNMDKMTPISSGFKFLEYEHKPWLQNIYSNFC